MKIVLACVAENKPDYDHKVLILFHSIRKFGGELATAECIANYVGGVNPEIAKQLQKIKVRVNIIEPFDLRSPHCNKIRMLELEDEYDVLVTLDCDMAVTRDFSSILTRELFMAKPTNTSTLEIKEWERLFEYYHIPFPNHRVFTDYSRAYSVPYFNSGLLCIPKKYAEEIRENWARYSIALLNDYELIGGEIARNRFYTDQFALTLAICGSAIPYYVIGSEYNFPTPTAHAPQISRMISPFVLHYHWHVEESGLLKYTGNAKVDAEIEKTNHLIEELALLSLITDRRPIRSETQ